MHTVQLLHFNHYSFENFFYTLPTYVLFQNYSQLLPIIPNLFPLINQVRVWFLEIVFVREVCMYVCVHPQAIKSHAK